jgi:hypothetical protein
MKIDREYFERNPQATDYTRKVVPGEFAETNPGAKFVRVTQLAPGFRMREPIW